MARTHALSGAVAGLTGSALLVEVGFRPHPLSIAVGSLIAAGAALLPDADHPGSTVAYSLGRVSRWGCELVASTCATIHARTRTPLDRVDRDGHRTASHTALAALLVGLVTAGVCWAAGRVGTALVVGALLALALRGGARGRWRSHTRLLLAAGVGGLLGYHLPDSGWWIGLAVALGYLTHLVGDAMTNSGCPMLWPLRIGGRRWYPVGTPTRLRFRTGGGFETAVWWVLLAAGFASAGWLTAIS